MRGKRYLTLLTVLVLMSGFMVSGCAVNFYKQNPRSKTKITELERQISDLEAERAKERAHFEDVKRMLESRLKDQIKDKSVSLEMDERGLVIILSDDILFDSGKSEIKDKVSPVLDKVSRVITEEVPDKNIGVYGNTDNVPIKYSNWKSNWELSTARATNVLHYLVSQGVSPNKLSATGYGEHRPIASNDTAAGRSMNRRVEIVILPDFVEQRQDIDAFDSNIK
ncbi:MAG: flagellar motor protein MotB [Candidatus Omnitrophica bacterium]|nr:flagellar motor protein MotB [Candidatus Omnitrophota bacterium]MDD5487591.1 flagellar motor protein MotB [Candidatus Omnitrophota bacterium]